MRKRINYKVLSIILVFIFVMNFSSSNSLASESVMPIPTDRSNEFYITQAESNEVYNQLLNSFTVQSNSNTAQKRSSLLNAVDVYPNYYGGAYIDDETGKLVVLVTDSSVSNKSEVRNMTGNSTNVLFEACEVPLNDMYDVIEYLSNKISYLFNMGIEIDYISDDIMNQRVVISVINLDSEKEKIIRSLVDCDYLYFENSAGVVEQASKLGGGNAIVSANNGLGSTLGFAATRNGVSGYVIAGHAGDFVGEVFRYNGTNIGSVTVTAYRNNSTADAAFITANSNFTPSQQLCGTGTIWGTRSNIAVNTVVCMLGKTSVSLQSGQIESVNTTSTTNGVSFLNQCSATYSCQDGDSGAPVMTYDGRYDVSRYTLYGIHRALRTSQDSTNLGIFSPYSNIQAELGVTAITGM